MHFWDVEKAWWARPEWWRPRDGTPALGAHAGESVSNSAVPARGGRTQGEALHAQHRINHLLYH